MADPAKFVMPEGAVCDVPGCGKLATDALIATRAPRREVPGSDGAHVYFCEAHIRPVMDGKVPMPDARHNPWPKKA